MKDNAQRRTKSADEATDNGAEQEQTEKLRYDHSELPRPKNLLLYHYRAFMKLFFIAFIGVGSIILAVLVFPWIRVFVHPNRRFQIAARKFVSTTFSAALFLMNITGIVKIYVDDKAALKGLTSKIIVANHCSILDFVILMALVPNANCIVRESLRKTPLAGVINQAYIVNSLDFDELCRVCKDTLDAGSNVIIFPEGTRTPRHGKNAYKKGAARIARFATADVQPVLIAGSDKYGLGKNDPFWSFNPVEPLIYDLKILPQIKIADYLELSEIASAKRITDRMHSQITDAAKQYSLHHPHCKTLNNIS